jgi:hypothetical protein
MARMNARVIVSFLAAFLVCAPASAGPVLEAVPSQPETSVRYLIYLHGLDVENNGPNGSNRAYGTADHHGVARALADRGYTVIAELRPRGTVPRQYADKVAGQIAALRGAGVAPARITVAGFSKGGLIALLSAAAAGEPDVNFVVMAGCGAGRFAAAFQPVVESAAARMKGRMLSIYERDDRDGASCREAFARAGEGFKGEEMVLTAGGGHGLFYRPDSAWIEPVARWLAQ